MRVLPFPSDLGEVPAGSGAARKMGPYQFKAITPVFGAGVEPRKLDSVTPLRGQTVRGHLRFWWRATCGRRFARIDHLRKAETALWGWSSSPGLVDVEVNATKRIDESCAHNGEFRAHYPKYALFPFQEITQQKLDWGRQWFPFEFELRITVRSSDAGIQQEIESTLWAWANFGGIGSRTRRGCGAIFCPNFAPHILPTEGWVGERLSPYPLAAGEALWPRLGNEPMLHDFQDGALKSWEKAVEILAEFRQYPPVGRSGNRANNNFGRSHWPEADSIRANLRGGNPAHRVTQTVSDPRNSPAFPRAEFGLPYQVKFKDGDPDAALNCEVKPLKSSRLASPVILRPLALGPLAKQTYAMVLRLDAPPPIQVRVTRVEHPKNDLRFPRDPVIRDKLLTAYNGSPLQGRTQDGSALQAFIAFVKDQWGLG